MATNATPAATAGVDGEFFEVNGGGQSVTVDDLGPNGLEDDDIGWGEGVGSAEEVGPPSEAGERDEDKEGEVSAGADGGGQPAQPTTVEDEEEEVFSDDGGRPHGAEDVAADGKSGESGEVELSEPPAQRRRVAQADVGGGVGDMEGTLRADQEPLVPEAGGEVEEASAAQEEMECGGVQREFESDPLFVQGEIVVTAGTSEKISTYYGFVTSEAIYGGNEATEAVKDKLVAADPAGEFLQGPARPVGQEGARVGLAEFVCPLHPLTHGARSQKIFLESESAVVIWPVKNGPSDLRSMIVTRRGINLQPALRGITWLLEGPENEAAYEVGDLSVGFDRSMARFLRGSPHFEDCQAIYVAYSPVVLRRKYQSIVDGLAGVQLQEFIESFPFEPHGDTLRIKEAEWASMSNGVDDGGMVTDIVSTGNLVGSLSIFVKGIRHRSQLAEGSDYVTTIRNLFKGAVIKAVPRMRGFGETGLVQLYLDVFAADLRKVEVIAEYLDTQGGGDGTELTVGGRQVVLHFSLHELDARERAGLPRFGESAQAGAVQKMEKDMTAQGEQIAALVQAMQVSQKGFEHQQKEMHGLLAAQEVQRAKEAAASKERSAELEKRLEEERVQSRARAAQAELEASELRASAAEQQQMMHGQRAALAEAVAQVREEQLRTAALQADQAGHQAQQMALLTSHMSQFADANSQMGSLMAAIGQRLLGGGGNSVAAPPLRPAIAEPSEERRYRSRSRGPRSDESGCAIAAQLRALASVAYAPVVVSWGMVGNGLTDGLVAGWLTYIDSMCSFALQTLSIADRVYRAGGLCVRGGTGEGGGGVRAEDVGGGFGGLGGLLLVDVEAEWNFTDVGHEWMDDYWWRYLFCWMVVLDRVTLRLGRMGCASGWASIIAFMILRSGSGWLGRLARSPDAHGGLFFILEYCGCACGEHVAALELHAARPRYLCRRGGSRCAASLALRGGGGGSGGGGDGGERGRVSESASEMAMVWNARALRPLVATGDKGDSASRLKLEWLATVLSTERPAVLGLLEVGGGKEGFRALRKWARGLQYSCGVSFSDGGAGDDGANAVVVMVAKERGKMLSSCAVAERALGARVRGKDGVVDSFVFVHGLHTAQFSGQIEAAHGWLARMGGGLMCGDFNRVCCARWRCGEHSLSEGDRALRRVACWHCECCNVDSREEQLGDARFVGWRVGEAVATRWVTNTDGATDLVPSQGEARWVRPSALLDGGIEVGPPRWVAAEVEWAEVEGRCEAVVPLSDHALLRFVRAAGTAGGERRPMPVKLGGRGGRRASELYAQAPAEPCRSAAQEVVRRARAAGERAQVEAAEEAVAKELRARKRESDAARLGSWQRRLKEALRLRRQGVEALEVEGGMLFHRRTGLVKMRARALRLGREPWTEIVRRCRRIVATARRRLAAQQRKDDRVLLGGSRRIETALAKGEVGEALQQSWKLLSCRGGADPLQFVYEGDDVETEPFDVHSASGRRALGAAGARVVDELDVGALPEGARAWMEVFFDEYATACAAGGEEWRLGEQLTWPLFRQVVSSMPKGKAVGSGGLSVELLRSLGEDAQMELFQAMKEDVAHGELSEDWRRVLYALLVKGYPNDPRKVCDRREIALMAVEMKVLLQMVRRAVYTQMTGRLALQQVGWIAGFGVGDAAVTATALIQQARATRHPLWLLYIDLAKFFPRIRRDISSIAGLARGLPAEVTELVLMIYGAHGRGRAAESARCFFDSDGGLGDGFHNWMGRLMGCVLAPDDAKIFVNCIVAALQLTTRGVRLYGAGGKRRNDWDVWQQISQIAYADDWMGAYASRSPAAVVEAWALWSLWEPIFGAEIGVKKKLKTVLTGVAYDEHGRPCAVADPELRTADGRAVPWMPHTEMYKYLGRPQRADGDDSAALVALRSKVRCAIARLWRVRDFRADTFSLMSDALLGGTASMLLQSLHVSWKEADGMEGWWRRCFNAKARRHHDAPRMEIYAKQEGGKRRRKHLWAVGLSAMYAAMSKALGDIAPTQARMAARSMLALRMERWGCRGDPSRWGCQHLVIALERSLAAAKCRFLGDAWLLVDALVARVSREEMSPGHGSGRAGEAWLEMQRREQHGRWEWMGEIPLDEPLHPEAVHWALPRSPVLFEAAEVGGLGAPVCGGLLNAGVVALGHVCGSAVRGSGLEGRWLSFAEARKEHGLEARLRGEWEELLGWLGEGGVRPCRAEGVRARSEGWSVEGGGGGGGRGVIDAEACARLAREAKGMARAERESQVEERSRGEWIERLQAVVPGLGGKRVPAVAWDHGAPCRMEAETGPCVFTVCTDERSALRRGGERGWLRDGAAGVEVGKDGFAVGWQLEVKSALSSLSLDSEGFVQDVVAGSRLDVYDMQGLSPGPKLFAVAREMLGDVPVFADGGKRSKLHVNLLTSRAAFREMCVWQARIQATAAFASDGGRRVRVNEEGIPQRLPNGDPDMVSARASIGHDGDVIAGVVEEAEGENAYLGELAALIDRFSALPDGGRVIAVFDATSPVLAALRFNKQHARRKGDYYASQLLDTLLVHIGRMRVVVLLWQRSHMGAAHNEAADAECTRALLADEAPVVVRREESRFCSMRQVAPERGYLSWARRGLLEVVDGRLAACVSDTQLWGDCDLRLGSFSSEDEMLAMAVCGGRAAFGDAKRYRGSESQEVARLMGCPFGCGVPCTWSHVQCFCPASELAEPRKAWEAEVKRVDALLGAGLDGSGSSGNSKRLPHSQLEAIKESLRKGRQGVLDFDEYGTLQQGEQKEVLVRRAVGRLVRVSGDGKVDGAVTTVRAVRLMVLAGLDVQREARRYTAQWERELRELARQRYLSRKYGRLWRRRVVLGGPQRRSALAGWAEARDRVLRATVSAFEEGWVGEAQAMEDVLRVLGVCAEAAEEERAHFSQKGSALAEWALVAYVRRWRALRAERLVTGEGHVMRESWCRRSVVVRERVVLARGGGVRVAPLGLEALRDGDPFDGREGDRLRSDFDWFFASLLRRTGLTELDGMVREGELWRDARSSTFVVDVGLDGRITELRQDPVVRAGLLRAAHVDWLRWRRLRGAGLLRRYVSRARAERALQDREAGALAMREWVAHGSCRGEGYEVYHGSSFVFARSIEGGRRGRAAARKQVRAACARKLREPTEAMLEGMEPDDYRRCRVRSVLDAKRVGGGLRVHVEWEGRDEHGAPWPSSWVKGGDLTKDLRGAAWAIVGGVPPSGEVARPQRRTARQAAIDARKRMMADAFGEEDAEGSAEEESESDGAEEGEHASRGEESAREGGSSIGQSGGGGLEGAGADEEEEWCEVERVLDVDGEIGSGGWEGWCAKLAWKGCDAAGHPWKDSWMEFKRLSDELRREAVAMARALFGNEAGRRVVDERRQQEKEVEKERRAVAAAAAEVARLERRRAADRRTRAFGVWTGGGNDAGS